TTERLSTGIEVALVAVPRPTTGNPVPTLLDPGNAPRVRGSAVVDHHGPGPTIPGDGTVQGDQLALIRLTPVDFSSGYFPGATVVFSTDIPAGALESSDLNLSVECFLTGALATRLPGTWVSGTRWFYLAADGSI